MNLTFPTPAPSPLLVEIDHPAEWLAIYVMPRHEKRIAEHLCGRKIEHFLPCYEAQRKWKDGSKVTLRLPLFPGYLFVRTSWTKRIAALEVPGVVSVVGSREGPRIPDAYIDGLREGLQSGRIEPHPYLAVGTMVRVKSGLMAGMCGVLLRKKSGCRIVLTLQLIMKSIAVEVDINDVEPIHPACPPL